MKKIVLAYSGGLDTSVIVHWLKWTHRVPVIAYIADVGQGENLRELEAKALATGAVKARVYDLKQEFARDFVFPAIRAHAIYETAYLLGTSLARPLIAKVLVECALEEGADAVAHGATGKGNDQVRFELTVRALCPQLRVVAPWREWNFTSRKDLISYAHAHGIPIPVSLEKPYSTDANLMHVSHEGGILESPWTEPPEEIFKTTVSPEKAPDRPETVEIDFEAGIPRAVGGQPLQPARLLETLNAIGGRHGVGRADLVENRFVGMKSRGVYETPGGTILHAAHRAVESITLDREVLRLQETLAPKIAELIYYGFWFSPEMKVLMALVEEAQKNVTGTARLKLYKGAVTVLGRKSPCSLYQTELVSFDGNGGYNPSDATGFIRLQGLRLALEAYRANGQEVNGSAPAELPSAAAAEERLGKAAVPV